MLTPQILADKTADCFKRKQIRVCVEQIDGIPVIRLKPNALGSAEIELELRFSQTEGGVMTEYFARIAAVNFGAELAYGLNELNCSAQIGSYAVLRDNLIYRYQLYLRSELGCDSAVINSLELVLNQIDFDYAQITELLK